MLEVNQRLGQGVAGVIHERLFLSHEKREKGRIKATAESGTEVRIFLERGTPLAIGEVLRSRCGKNVLIEGAVEPVIIALADDWQTFSRACYHLGNRHVKIQIGDRWLRITPDHVLAEMLQGLGLSTNEQQSVFQPENGAYAKGSSAHGHSHHHGDESQEHEQEHRHVHHTH